MSVIATGGALTVSGNCAVTVVLAASCKTTVTVKVPLACSTPESTPVAVLNVSPCRESAGRPRIRRCPPFAGKSDCVVGAFGAGRQRRRRDLERPVDIERAAADALPPGLVTTIDAVLGPATSAAGTLAVSSVALPKVVVNGLPSNETCDPDTKLEPLTTRLKVGEPAATKAGERELMAGRSTLKGSVLVTDAARISDLYVDHAGAHQQIRRHGRRERAGAAETGGQRRRIPRDLRSRNEVRTRKRQRETR